MTDAASEKIIRIVAAVIRDPQGHTLLVRKRGTDTFMQPGGKLATGENPLAALAREIEEELGCDLELASCQSRGTFAAPAANEAGYIVEAELFEARLAGPARAQGEIEELAWIDPHGEPRLNLAPLTALHALPIARGWKIHSGSCDQ